MYATVHSILENIRCTACTGHWTCKHDNDNNKETTTKLMPTVHLSSVHFNQKYDSDDKS